MRRVWIGLLAALLVLGAVDTVAWFRATDRLASGFAAWTRAEQAAGWTVHAGPPRRVGWPLSAALVVPRLRLILAHPGPIDPFPVSWRVERLVLRLRPRWPLRLSIAAAGRQEIGAPGGSAIRFTASRFALYLPWHPAPGTAAADLVMRALRVGPTDRAALALGSLRLRVLRQAPGAAAAPGLRFALVVRDIALPAGRRWPLGRRIASVAVHGTLRGAVPDSGSPRQRAAAWQRAGGQLVLREAALRWGPLAASLAATVELNPALQPEGQGRAMVSGYAQALDTLAANGAVTNDTAVAAKAVLSLLATAPPHAGTDTVAIPVTLHNGLLNIDGLPLFHLPPLPSAIHDPAG